MCVCLNKPFSFLEKLGCSLELELSNAMPLCSLELEVFDTG